MTHNSTTNVLHPELQAGRVQYNATVFVRDDGEGYKQAFLHGMPQNI